jgi:crotonobetainyl-CoA:carnitine CoA-transferase CaiB-like acyl-CoA transferase
MNPPSTSTATPNPSAPALSGIRILDLTAIVFGPYASQTLADYGADIIKVEPPTGESTRFTGPAYEKGLSAIFLGVNRNKKSLCLDLKKPAAIEALLALVDQADVIMHSMRPQKMAALGLDAQTLLKRNPRLIYAGLYGFGEGGAYEGKPAYDDLIQGMSGVVDLMQRQSDQPRYLPTIAADKTCALVAVQGIMAALFQRERTGLGQFIEIPMFETMTAYLLVEHFYGHHLADREEPAGYPRALTKWRQPYKSTNGLISVMPYTDRHWQLFFKAAGYDNHANDPRFANIESRTENIAFVYETLGNIIATQTTDYWLSLCETNQIPAAVVNRLEDLEHDPHLKSVGMFQDVDDELGNTYRFVRNPVTMQSSKVATALAPRLGQHTEMILREAGLSDQTIAAMIESGAAKQHP